MSLLCSEVTSKRSVANKQPSSYRGSIYTITADSKADLDDFSYMSQLEPAIEELDEIDDMSAAADTERDDQQESKQEITPS